MARTIYIRCLYGIFGRETTKYTVIYGVYIRFWPTLFLSYRLVLHLSCRLVTLAAGVAAGKFLRYEENAPGVAAQTAYGIEAEVENYDQGEVGVCVCVWVGVWWGGGAVCVRCVRV